MKTAIRSVRAPWKLLPVVSVLPALISGCAAHWAQGGSPMSGWSGSQQSAPLRLETAATGYERYQPAEQLQRGSGGYSDHVQPPVIYRDDQYSATGVKLDRTAVTTASPVNMPTPLPDTVSVPSQPERPAIYGLPPAPVVDEPLQILDHGQPAAQRMAAAQMLEIPGPVDSPVALSLIHI